MSTLYRGAAHFRPSTLCLSRSERSLKQGLRFGFSWHQSVASFSDSALLCTDSPPPREEPESHEGLRGTSISGNLKRNLAFSSPVTQSSTPAKPLDHLETESTPLAKKKRRLNNKCISFVRSCLGLKSKFKRAVQDIIFLAVDTEGAKGSLTELGISALDTRDVRRHDPGPSALEWSRHISTRHFRLVEGKRYPFLFGGLERRLPLSVAPSDLKLHPDRRYILVGHDLGHDIDKLSSTLQLDLRNKSNIVAIIDTYTLSQHSREKLPRNLSELWAFLMAQSDDNVTPADVLKAFSSEQQSSTLAADLKHGFHNAGNDAFYNMHTLLLLALRPELLREPLEGSSMTGVFLTARSAAWRMD